MFTFVSGQNIYDLEMERWLINFPFVWGQATIYKANRQITSNREDTQKQSGVLLQLIPHDLSRWKDNNSHSLREEKRKVLCAIYRV